jgi:hypothetical protein
MSPASPARIAPLPPGIRITLARGAAGLINTAREPATFTVSSAKAGGQAKAANVASMAATARPLGKRFMIFL